MTYNNKNIKIKLLTYNMTEPVDINASITSLSC